MHTPEGVSVMVIQNVKPMTPIARLVYAVKCQQMAARMRAEGDIASAELNEWMAEGYAHPDPRSLDK
jgi:hypothetical protein